MGDHHFRVFGFFNIIYIRKISFCTWLPIFRERDLLLVPYARGDVTVVQWPPFLLASKVK